MHFRFKYNFRENKRKFCITNQTTSSLKNSIILVTGTGSFFPHFIQLHNLTYTSKQFTKNHKKAKIKLKTFRQIEHDRRVGHRKTSSKREPNHELVIVKNLKQSVTLLETKN
jgi:hypothetical protein